MLMHRVPVFFNLKFLQGGISLALPHNIWLINYQELINVNEGSIMSGNVDQMGMKHLPGEILKSTREISVEFKLPERGASLAGVEKALIEQALERTGGNQSRAARLLDITRHAIRHRMKKYGLL
jgi:two-component system NtrC family response regulator